MCSSDLVKNKIAGDVIEAQLTTPGALELQALFHRMAQRRVEVCAMEVSSIALDQFRTMGSRFQVGVFTNFTQDHLDYHQTMERYLEAKLKFFKDYELPCVVVNIDDEYSDRVLRVSSGARQLTFSLTQTSASFHVLECQFKKNGTSARIQTPRGEFEIKSPLIGAHNLQNILSVLAVVEGLGQDLTQAIKALETAPGAPGWPNRVCQAFTAVRPACCLGSRSAWAPNHCPMPAWGWRLMPGPHRL